MERYFIFLPWKLWLNISQFTHLPFLYIYFIHIMFTFVYFLYFLLNFINLITIIYTNYTERPGILQRKKASQVIIKMYTEKTKSIIKNRVDELKYYKHLSFDMSLQKIPTSNTPNKTNPALKQNHPRPRQCLSE